MVGTINNCSRFCKTQIAQLNQCCLPWGNMEHRLAPLRLPQVFGILIGSQLKWSPEMDSHWARPTWEYSMLFQNSLVRSKIPDPQIVFCQRKCQKNLTNQQNQTKQKSKNKTSTKWLMCSLGIEETRVHILKPTWARLLNLTPRYNHLKLWKYRYSGMPSICSDLTELGSPKAS